MDYTERLDKLRENWIGHSSPYALVQDYAKKGYDIDKIIKLIQNTYPNITRADIIATYKGL